MRAIGFIGSLFFFLSFKIVASLSAEQVVVIVSLESPIYSISNERLQGAYLGEGKKWEDDSIIIPVNLIETHPASGLFMEKVLKKTAADMKVLWIQQIFSGKGSPPIVMKEDREVKAYVASHKGAIGYIRSSALDSTVRSIPVDGKVFIQ
jgi:ABC-type phosphate transport system substrate-binding protein